MKPKLAAPDKDELAQGGEHYRGHRKRLRARFAEVGERGFADYELLELLLFRFIPQKDVKPIAKALIARFGSFAEVLAATSERLQEVDGIGDNIHLVVV